MFDSSGEQEHDSDIRTDEFCSHGRVADRCDYRCKDDFGETADRRERPDPTIDVIESLGATYVNSNETSVPSVPNAHEPMDLVFEATGYSRHGVETVDALAPGGVGVLLGVPEDREIAVDVGRLHREMVLDNKALVGSVNSSRRHAETASDRLADLPDWLVDRVVTGVYPPERLDAAFAADDTTIKTAVELAQHEER